LLAKEEKIAADLADKEAKEQRLADEKAAKEQKKIDDKAAKEAKIAADLLAKEQKIAADLAAKEAKKLQLEQEKAAKEAKKAEELAAKEAKKAEAEQKKAKKVAEPKKQREGTRTIVAEPKFKVGDVFVFRNGKDPVVDGTVTEVFAGKSFVEYNVDLGDKTIKTNEGFMMPKKAEMQAQAVAVAAAPKKVTVKRITIDGKQYLKTAENLLYDPETKEEMGIYDPETNTIKELPDDDEDEVEEDGYTSE
jgi:hypothetical protein